MQRANEKAKNGEALAVTNWSLASRALYYNRDYSSSVYLIDKRFDQFDIWEKESAISKDLIFINTKAFRKSLEKYVQCDSIEKIDNFDVILNRGKVNNISLEKCVNFQGLK
jgi:hypothetical protein